MLPCRWDDRPQQYALGVLLFHYMTRTVWGAEIDFGRPGDRNIAIIRQPHQDGVTTDG